LCSSLFIFQGVKEEKEFSSCVSATDFTLMILDKTIEDLLFQSNLYAIQKRKTLRLKRHEVLSFLGITFYGLAQTPFMDTLLVCE
jgi:hypothetical protein